MATTREIINISLPPDMAKDLRAEVSENGFASVSEYIRHLFREERKRIVAKQLHAQRRSGKWIKAASLRDLR
jgi:Arc/MetJ-type ribon-helix-helix transcriptional regulator